MYLCNPMFFFKTPGLSNLIGVNLVLTETDEWSIHKRVLKCRELISTFPAIIANPSYGYKSGIQLVLQKIDFNSNELQSKILQLGLNITSTQEVTPEMFQNSARYTVNAKIAPTWNAVGPYLVQGREFLQSTTPMNAIRNFQMIVSNHETHLTFEAVCIRLPQMTKEHLLGLVGPDMSEEHICYALPELNECKVQAVFNELPPESPFKSFEAMKRHWKNMYGYRLTENNFFVSVNFSTGINKPYHYPSQCIKPCQPTVVPRSDPLPITAAFLRDFQIKVGQLCGKGIRFLDTRAAYPISDLTSAALPNPMCGLSYTVTKPNAPYRKVSSTVPSPVTAIAPENNTNIPFTDLGPVLTHENHGQKFVPIFKKAKNPPEVLDLSKAKENLSNSVQIKVQKRKMGKSGCGPIKRVGKKLQLSQEIVAVPVDQTHMVASVTQPSSTVSLMKVTSRPLASLQKKVNHVNVNTNNVSGILENESGISNSSQLAKVTVSGTNHQKELLGVDFPIQNQILAVEWEQIFQAAKENNYLVSSLTVQSPIGVKESVKSKEHKTKKPVKEVPKEQIEEVVPLLKANNFQAVTVAVLQAWLRERGVRFRSKDVKTTLITLAMKIIGGEE